MVKKTQLSTIIIVIIAIMLVGASIYFFYNKSVNAKQYKSDPNYAYCAGLKDIDSCLKDVAIGKDRTMSKDAFLKLDPDYCDDINDDEIKADCFFNIKTKKEAIQTKSKELCEEITDLELEAVCLTDFDIFVTINKNPELCETISGDYCYMKLAVELENISLCDKILEPNKRYGGQITKLDCLREYYDKVDNSLEIESLPDGYSICQIEGNIVTCTKVDDKP